ncbi:PAS domain-containing protein [Sorangium sp. So ce406]|uniref:PAS domain-containing protein n=1 Tax=Sorangium sp. So ce406 TaxID=3133311 RepID=UPI003F5B2138
MTSVEDLRAELTRMREENAALTRARDEARRERDEARRERDELRTAILGMPAAVGVMVGPEHVFTLVNDAWRALEPSYEPLGKRLVDVIPPPLGPRIASMLEPVFQTGEPLIAANVPFSLPGSTERRFLTFHYSALRRDSGEIFGIVFHGMDVTRQLRAQEEVQSLNSRLRTLLALAENAPDGIVVTERGRVTYANPAFRRMSGYGQEIVEATLPDLVDDESWALLEARRQEGASPGAVQASVTCCRRDGSTFPGEISTFPIRDEGGQIDAEGAIFRDLTERRRAEQEQQSLQEDLIAAQQRAIRELSTPLIPLARQLVVMPLVGTIDSARSEQILETLLQGIAAHQAAVAILDTTGVRSMDEQVASSLLRTAGAARLLGTEVILTGISPEVARALVEIGTDLSGVVTRGTLEAGVAYALGRRRRSKRGS